MRHIRSATEETLKRNLHAANQGVWEEACQVFAPHHEKELTLVNMMECKEDNDKKGCMYMPC
jgi:hypothetical protein